MKIKELQGLSSEELVQKQQAFKKDIFDLNYQRRTGNVEKPSRFRMLKRDIARIMTVLRERELQNQRNRKTTQ